MKMKCEIINKVFSVCVSIFTDACLIYAMQVFDAIVRNPGMMGLYSTFYDIVPAWALMLFRFFSDLMSVGTILFSGMPHTGNSQAVGAGPRLFRCPTCFW